MEFLFDPNDEEEKLRKKIEEYYGDFSDNTRNKLFAKNIEKPTSVYDLMYPKQREYLLSKNISIFDKELDETSMAIRDMLLSKNNGEQGDLLSGSEGFRKSLEARNSMSERRDVLAEQSNEMRKILISKGIVRDADLLADSEGIRRDSVAKNKTIEVSEDKLSDNSEGYREGLISKNVTKEGDLLSRSEETRNANISKITTKEGDLKAESEDFRKMNIHKNEKDISLDQVSDIETQSVSFRDDLIAKNLVGKDKVPLDELFESARNALLTKGVSNGVDLLDISDAFRNALVSKNVGEPGDIEEVFESIREDLLSKNKPLNSEGLLESSEHYKDDLLKSNVVNETSLEELSKSIREGLISANVTVNSEDIVGLYDSVRNGLLSKNKSEDLNLLEIFNSERERLLSANKGKITDLSVDSESFREGQVSKNSTNETDLAAGSEQFRTDSLSLNSPKESDIESDSVLFRDGLLSNNKPNSSDIETDSVSFRDGLLSNNVPKFSDIETDSVSFRDGLLSNNVPKFSDLEVDSITFRDGLLANNVTNFSDIETDSITFRDDLLAANVPNPSDIKTDSVPFRDGLLAANVPNTSDIESDSIGFRDDLLAANIPNLNDIETDSVPFRDGLLSANIPNLSDIETDSVSFRDGLLSNNVSTPSDLLADSQNYYGNNILNNVPVNTDLLIDSFEAREALLSSNIGSNSDLLANSTELRNQLLARNTGGLIGLNISAAGTSTFLGVSRVLTQGVLYRALLLPRSKYRIRRDEYQDGDGTVIDGNVTTKEGATTSFEEERGFLLGGNAFEMDYSLTTSDAGALSLFGAGTRLADQTYSQTRDGIFYGDKHTVSHPEGDQLQNSTVLGSVTEAIRSFNISRNTYAVDKSYGVNNLEGFSYLSNLSINPRVGSTGALMPDLFQDLIQKSVGSLKPNVNDSAGTPTTPSSVIIDNGGGYFNSDPVDILSNNNKGGTIESNPAKLAANQVVGNPFDTPDFRSGTRGVKRVINLIKNSDLEFASNYDPQRTKSYVTGLKADSSTRTNAQRYTIANPYAPGKAQKLNFMLQNYSNGEKLYLPPYITSMQHNSSASWNEVNFLGRPEALYTYNNSKRAGSISFFVLTDYASQVDIGLADGLDGPTTLTEAFDKSFSSVAMADALEAQLKDVNQKISENAEIQQSTAAGETAKLKKEESDLKKLKTKIEKEKREADKNKSVGPPNYAESSKDSYNIYRDIIGSNSSADGEIVSTIEDTETRLGEMKNKLKFQPSFFSGDKVDFVHRIEFLEKMTRPSRNNGPGFSFLRPPVCHIHLGDWLNHDIIIESIDYDYTDAPWTLDGLGRVQPMWTQVTMSFNIIGRYKHGAGDALTSTDRGGFFRHQI